MTVVYLDTSAAMKLVTAEPQSAVLEVALRASPWWLSSQILAVELSCAGQRVGVPPENVSGLLDTCQLLPITGAVLTRAAQSFSPSQRALDAIHLASALDLPDAPVFVSYDERQLEAAQNAGLTCLSPA